MELTEYIKIYFKNSQASFARAQNVKPQQVTQWINNRFIVIDDWMLSPRRKLKRTQELVKS